MFLENEKNKYFLNTLDKISLFEKADRHSNTQPKNLAKQLIEKADTVSCDEYFEFVLELLKKFSLYFPIEHSINSADFVGDISVAVYHSGYHPRRYTFTLLGKTFKQSKLTPEMLAKYIQSKGINTLLTGERGLYLHGMEYSKKIHGFYLLKSGITFTKEEEAFLRFKKTGFLHKFICHRHLIY